MPKGLHDAFQETLKRIENQPTAKRLQGYETLKWVFLAERQLSVDELCYALAIKPGDEHFDEEGLPTHKSLLDCCLGLVIVDAETASFRLVHKSLQDFLERQYECKKVFQEGQQEISRALLTFQGFHSDYHPDKESCILYDYAIPNWGHHVRKSPSAVESWEAIFSLLHDERNISYGVYPWMDCSPGELEDMKATQILHIAMHFGLSGLVQYIIDNYVVDLRDEPFNNHHPPLLRAAMHGHEEVVRILIEKGADVNLEQKYNYTGLTSLCMAVKYGHEGVAVIAGQRCGN
jgi:hypothetical protein